MNKKTNIELSKQELINDLLDKQANKIIEKENVDLLIKLINNADNLSEANAIAMLGTTYKQTGFHFDKRLEKWGDTIKYYKKNEELSFVQDKNKLTHKLIIGDNYDALLNLLITHKGMIDVIYIDPPYGKNDMGEFAETNYNNSITRDNLLSMLYPRLILAKQLLSNEGMIFVSIDDKNQAYIKCLMDEIFGEHNFITNFVVNSAPAGQQSSVYVAIQQSYCLMYRKTENMKISNYSLSEEEIAKKYKDGEEDGIRYYTERIWKRGVGGKKEDQPSLHFPVYYDENTKDIFIDKEIDSLDDERKTKLIKIIPYHTKGVLGRWTWARETMILNRNSLIVKKTSGEYKLYKKVWETEDNGAMMKSIIDSDLGRTEIGSLEIKSIMNDKIFLYPKSTIFIKTLIGLHPNKNAIVLDFFAGSGTTGQAVQHLNLQDNGNRQFILCTNNEITELNPNGIAYDVTSKRLKRVMTGECYDGSKNFEWLNDNKPYGGNLEVFEIKEVNSREQGEGKSAFDVIDETLYGLPKFTSIEDKINWICSNFDKTQKYIEGE